MPRRGARFETTQWSIVLAAGRGGGGGSRDALAALCESYSYPVYAYVRRRGHGMCEQPAELGPAAPCGICRDGCADSPYGQQKPGKCMVSVCKHARVFGALARAEAAGQRAR